jgi:dihydrolipoamide dehydrogenase
VPRGAVVELGDSADPVWCVRADALPVVAIRADVPDHPGGRPGHRHPADAAGVAVDERGFIPVDKQLRTNVPHIFAIGDVVGQPMLAHKATHEGRVAAEVAAGHKAYFDAADGRSIGCGIVGPSAGDLIAEATHAIEMGADAEDIGLTIHPHPTLSETIGLATEAFSGTITDLYLPKQR